MKMIFFNRSHLKRVFILLTILAIFVLGRLFWIIMTGHHIKFKGSLRLHTHGGEQEDERYLTFKSRQFYLGGKPLTLLSGAVHYFRSVPDHWKDRLHKAKACGLNTIETYVPWNLHEPIPQEYNFRGMLDIRKYIKLAQELGLYVILRPGPYICSEWDYGGLPSWLLADPKMKVRSNYLGYQNAVARYFKHLLSKVVDLQFSNGGPIIAVQVENEFGSYSNETDHLLFIRNVLLANGIKELLLTSDNLSGMNTAPFYANALPMANFKYFENGAKIFKRIKQLDDDFPLMVLEFWTGWFDHWGQDHNTFSKEDYHNALKEIVLAGASVNFYMFHGGTNFGFMAGANMFTKYKPDVTSYDYDALLSENGNITQKYLTTRFLLFEFVLKKQGIQSLPQLPSFNQAQGYGIWYVGFYLPWEQMLEAITDTVKVDSPVYMEMLQLKSGFGQSYGYIVYRKQIGKGNTLKLPGPVQDRAQILLNGHQVSTVEVNDKQRSIQLNSSLKMATLDIVVENLGRVNYVKMGSNILNEQRKGLNGTVYLDTDSLQEWLVFPLDFRKEYLSRIATSPFWQKYQPSSDKPSMFKATLKIEGTPKDTFMYMREWTKGVVFINGFNLGRYWNIGPQQTLFVPGPILRQGDNEVLIFEQHKSNSKIAFLSIPILGSK